MSRTLALMTLSALLAVAPHAASGYPLDGYEYTGIHRLEVQRLVQTGGATGGSKRPSGELLPLERVQPRLLAHKQFELPEPDPTLTASVKRLLGAQVSRYGIALLDLSDLTNIRYAEWNGNQLQNPGSVAKLLVALAVFQTLADIHPDDIAARERVLRETVVTADEFSVYDHHTVQKHDEATGKVWRAPIQQGDKGSLWTYVDWMMSPSSNSAAGMVQKQLILMKQYGKQYPPTDEESKRFFSETPKKELSAIFAEVMQGPVTRNGLDLAMLRQGSFFTHQGKVRVPGTSSHATPRELMRFLVRMEQGRLVDEWSSRELKRLLYITERRIRYASAGALRPDAVYFKSGSLYSCAPEEGFVCLKYHGNKRNYMNSAAIVESPAGQNHLFYMTTVLSNVLRKNSAEDHRDLARAIHLRLVADHPSPDTGAEGQPLMASYGEGFIGYAEERRAVTLAFETQEALLDLGFDIGEIDGQIGSRTRGAIREFERQQGVPATGQPSENLLERMRRVALEKGLARPSE